MPSTCSHKHITQQPYNSCTQKCDGHYMATSNHWTLQTGDNKPKIGRTTDYIDKWWVQLFEIQQCGNLTWIRGGNNSLGIFINKEFQNNLISHVGESAPQSEWYMSHGNTWHPTKIQTLIHPAPSHAGQSNFQTTKHEGQQHRENPRSHTKSCNLGKQQHYLLQSWWASWTKTIPKYINLWARVYSMQS